MLKIRKGWTFDDVLLAPKYSEIQSRSDVDLSVDLGKDVRLTIPVVSANMSSVTEDAMAKKIASMGGLALLHRFCSTEYQAITFKNIPDIYHKNVGCSIGIKEEDFNAAEYFISLGCSIICVDVAHAHHKNCLSMIERIATEFPSILLIAGNVATADGALALYNAGADVVKCGIGSGSICSTRIETGNGVPQLTALSDIYEASWEKTSLTKTKTARKFAIIADGGIRKAGDCVKALCFSDAVMLGNMLAGTDEAPGEISTINGIQYKSYDGSSTHKTSHIEGVKALVPLKGPVKSIITSILDGITSGCSYQGVLNLTDLRKDPQFIEISQAGLIESHPHDVKIRN